MNALCHAGFSFFFFFAHNKDLRFSPEQKLADFEKLTSTQRKKKEGKQKQHITRKEKQTATFKKKLLLFLNKKKTKGEAKQKTKKKKKRRSEDVHAKKLCNKAIIRASCS